MSTTETSFTQLVDHAITKSPYLSGRNVRIETQEGRVVILGTVRSYYQKQMAQEAVRRIDGVRAIENRLTVVA